jgi:hypothetical protein
VSQDFRRLWAAYTVSELGTALSLGALPLGPWIEVRRKRPVMIGADLLRFAALAGLPAAARLGRLSYPQIQPICIAAGGLLAAATSTRTALFVVAAVVLASALPLPWRVRAPALSSAAS